MPIPNNNAPAGKLVSIPEDELKAILAVNKMLLAQFESGGDSSQTRKKVKDHKVTICFVNGHPVVGMVDQSRGGTKEYIYELPNPRKPGDMISYVDLILDGVDEPLKKVNFVQFLNEAERQELLYTDVKDEPWEISQGTTEATEVKDYHMEGSGNRVSLDVTGKHRTFKVILSEGRELWITEDAVNMTK